MRQTSTRVPRRSFSPPNKTDLSSWQPLEHTRQERSQKGHCILWVSRPLDPHQSATPRASWCLSTIPCSPATLAEPAPLSFLALAWGQGQVSWPCFSPRHATFPHHLYCGSVLQTSGSLAENKGTLGSAQETLCKQKNTNTNTILETDTRRRTGASLPSTLGCKQSYKNQAEMITTERAA